MFGGNEFLRIFKYPSIALSTTDGSTLFGEDLTGSGILDVAGRLNDGYLNRHDLRYPERLHTYKNILGSLVWFTQYPAEYAAHHYCFILVGGEMGKALSCGYLFYSFNHQRQQSISSSVINSIKHHFMATP